MTKLDHREFSDDMDALARDDFAFFVMRAARNLTTAGEFKAGKDPVVRKVTEVFCSLVTFLCFLITFLFFFGDLFFSLVNFLTTGSWY